MKGVYIATQPGVTRRVVPIAVKRGLHTLLHTSSKVKFYYKYILIWLTRVCVIIDCLITSNVGLRCLIRTRAWDSLPPQTRAASSLPTFRRETKSHLFRQSFGWRKSGVVSDDWQLNCTRRATLSVLFVKCPRNCCLVMVSLLIIICPIAIAYSMGQIIKSVCVQKEIGVEEHDSEVRF